VTTRRVVVFRQASARLGASLKGRGSRIAVGSACLLGALARAAPAQLISIKTVPVAQADQFDIFPSDTRGMAGVSIAVADTLLDPFVNPAMTARVRGAHFFGSPAFYSVSHHSGGGRTLPLGVLASSRAWYGGLALALQEIDPADAAPQLPVFTPSGQSVGVVGQRRETHQNNMAVGILGKEFPQAKLSLGGSVQWAGLNAIDGVDLLYAGSRDVGQDGHMLDLRLGLLKEWAAERSLQAVLVHNRFRMTHDVTYVDLLWDPLLAQPVEHPRVDHNLDRTNTWGLHLAYEHPLAASGWRIGGLVTGNLLSHPKIPNYEIMSIPRDPGHSSAYNIGVGISHVSDSTTFAIDAIYEPVWSNTWAEAAEPIETSSGATIPAGGKTIDNHFRFSNAVLRVGVGQDLPLGGRSRPVGLQLGLATRTVHYWLTQYDRVAGTARGQEVRWREWTPTWGASLRFPGMELQYRGRVTSGTGRPGVVPQGGFDFLSSSSLGSNIIAAPSGPMTLDDVRVVTHQLSVSLPLH
jgi:hypothetical protein